MEAKLRSKIGGDVSISRSNLVVVIGQAMKQAELFAELSGLQKRQLVLNTLRTMVEDSKELDGAAKTSLVETLMHFAPPMIDLVVNAGTLGLNLVRSACCR